MIDAVASGVPQLKWPSAIQASRVPHSAFLIEASIAKQMRNAKASVKEPHVSLTANRVLIFRILQAYHHDHDQLIVYECNWQDTPNGLPDSIHKLGSYSRFNVARDFNRAVKPPLDC